MAYEYRRSVMVCAGYGCHPFFIYGFVCMVLRVGIVCTIFAECVCEPDAEAGAVTMSAKSGKMNRMRRRDMASRLCAASIGIHGSCFADAAVVRTRNMGCIQSHIRPVRCECLDVSLRWQEKQDNDCNTPKEDAVGAYRFRYGSIVA